MSVTCTNCGKPGHYYKSCVEPITSFGIILVQVLGCKREEIQQKFLSLIRSKDTYHLISRHMLLIGLKVRLGRD